MTVQVTGQEPRTYAGSFAADDPGDGGVGGSGTELGTFTF